MSKNNFCKFQKQSPRGALLKRCSKKFPKTHRKTPVLESLFYKFADPRPATLLKERLWHRSFPENFAKFLRTPFFTDHLWWLLLKFDIVSYPTGNYMFKLNNRNVGKINKICSKLAIKTPERCFMDAADLQENTYDEVRLA